LCDLSNRIARVALPEGLSGYGLVVAQGSVSDPLFFLLYINNVVDLFVNHMQTIWNFSLK